eukprot:UN23267
MQRRAALGQQNYHKKESTALNGAVQVKGPILDIMNSQR